MLIKIICLAVLGTFITVILKKHCKELVPFFEVAVVVAFLLVDEDHWVGHIRVGDGTRCGF